MFIKIFCNTNGLLQGRCADTQCIESSQALGLNITQQYSKLLRKSYRQTLVVVHTGLDQVNMMKDCVESNQGPVQQPPPDYLVAHLEHNVKGHINMLLFSIEKRF